jgi:hypothetical protein
MGTPFFRPSSRQVFKSGTPWYGRRRKPRIQRNTTVISTQDFEFIGVSDEGDLEFDSDVIRLYQFLAYVNAGDDYTRSVNRYRHSHISPRASVGCTNAMVLGVLGN